jgi:hypothetical protein
MFFSSLRRTEAAASPLAEGFHAVRPLARSVLSSRRFSLDEIK